MLELTVTNGECEIGTVSIDDMTTASVFIAGDLGRAVLVSLFESPMEKKDGERQ